MVISFMMVKVVDLFQNNPVAVSIGSFPADDSFRFQVGKHPFHLPGAHIQVFGNLGGGHMLVGPKISKDAFLLVVEAFLSGNIGIGLSLVVDKGVQDLLQHKVDEGAAIRQV